jgi:hypothetical protein
VGIVKLLSGALGAWAAVCCEAAIGAIALYVEPGCPAPADQVQLVAYETAVPRLRPQPLSVTRAGNTFHVVGALTYAVVSPPPPALPLKVPVGSLAAGDYTFEFATRTEDASGLGPEVAQGSVSFSVSETPPVCTPVRLSITQGTNQVAWPGQPYPLAIVVRAEDASGRGVPGLDLRILRMIPPMFYQAGGKLGVTVQPSATALTTDANGLATFTATAGPDDGAVSYSIVWTQGPKVLRTVVNFGVARTPYGSAVPVVEYAEASTGSYFITADLAEQAILDEGRIPGWTRTNGIWLAFVDAEPLAQPPRLPVCRFFAPTWQNAHFFSPYPEECEALRRSGLWIEESANVFSLVLPAGDGSCPEGTAPVFRSVRFSTPVGHRYTESEELAVREFAYGATLEGNGGFPPVAMCGPR